MKKDMSPTKPHDLHSALISGDIEIMAAAPMPPLKPQGRRIDLVTESGNFQFALNRAKIERLPYIELSKEILDFILNGRSGVSVMYQGVRLFLQGTAEETLRIEGLDAERYSEALALKRNPEITNIREFNKAERKQ